MRLLAIFLWLASTAWSAAKVPTDIPNLAVWLDATDNSTMTLSTGLVDEWRSKTGAFTWTGTGAARPFTVSAGVDDGQAVDFNGAHSMIGPIYTTIVSSMLAHTVIVRTNTDSVTGARNIVSAWDAADSGVAMFYGTSAGEMRFGINWYEACVTGVDIATGTSTLAWVGDASNAFFYVNASLKQTKGSNLDTTTGGCVGSGAIVFDNALYLGRQGPFAGGEFWDGKVSDIVIYNRALSADEISSLGEYFQFGLNSQLSPYMKNSNRNNVTPPRQTWRP